MRVAGPGYFNVGSEESNSCPHVCRGSAPTAEPSHQLPCIYTHICKVKVMSSLNRWGSPQAALYLGPPFPPVYFAPRPRSAPAAYPRFPAVHLSGWLLEHGCEARMLVLPQASWFFPSFLLFCIQRHPSEGRNATSRLIITPSFVTMYHCNFVPL